jgi:4-aminobutyrate--pyruvate transaminase
MARDLEELILREGPDTVAAFIAEPVMGAGGVILPPKGYFQKIEALLDATTSASSPMRSSAASVAPAIGSAPRPSGSTRSRCPWPSLDLAYFPLGAISIEEDLYQAMLEESKKIGTFGHWLIPIPPIPSRPPWP